MARQRLVHELRLFSFGGVTLARRAYRVTLKFSNSNDEERLCEWTGTPAEARKIANGLLRAADAADKYNAANEA